MATGTEHTEESMHTGMRPRRELLNWRNAILVVFMLSGIGWGSWLSRIPDIRDALHLDTTAVGSLLFCASVGSIVGLVASNPVMNRFGARRGMLVAITTVALGMVVIGIGATVLYLIPVVIVGLVLIGLGSGACDVIMNVEAADVERELGKTILPLMHASFSLGTVFGAGIGAAAIALRVPVAWHFAGIAIVMIVVIAVATRSVPIRPELGDTGAIPLTAADKPGLWQSTKDFFLVWADWRLLIIGVVLFCMAYTEGSANDWLPLAVVDGHHQENAIGAAVLGAFVAAMTVGRIVGGPLVDRIGRVAAIRATALVGAAGLLCFIITDQLWLVVVGAVLWGLGASLGFPLAISAAADDPKRAAKRVSAVAIIGYAAFLVGPPLFGLLAQAVGILHALFAILALLVIAGLCSSALRPTSAAKKP